MNKHRPNPFHKDNLPVLTSEFTSHDKFKAAIPELKGSVVESCGYDKDTNTLNIEFANGSKLTVGVIHLWYSIKIS